MLSHSYNILIDIGVESPVHEKYFVDGFNATDKRFLSVFITNVQLPVESTNNSHMVIHTSMSNTYIIQARGSQKHLSDPTCAHGLNYHGKDRK